MATEDWIQESLARLESLEEERSRHEAALETADDAAALRMHAQAVERLDAKIRSLYAELEAAAEQGDGADASTSADDRADVDADDGEDDDELDDGDQQSGKPEVETRLFRRDDVAAQAAAVINAAPAQPAPVSSPVAAPFGGSPPAASPFGGSAPVASPFGGSPPAASPFGGSPPQASPFGGSAPASSFSSSSGAGFAAPTSSLSGSGGHLDDDEGKRSGAPWGLIITLILVAGGVGGYFALRPKDEPPPEVPAGPAKVIKAVEVPKDTQGPKVVKGSNVDSVKGSQFKDGRPHSGGGGASTPTPTDKPRKKDAKTTIVSTDDPLAGIN